MSTSTVTAYFQQTYRKTLAGTKLHQTAKAVEYFGDFAGELVYLDMLSESVLQRFMTYLQNDRGFGVRYAEMLAGAIRRLARHASPEAFPPKRPPAPDGPADEGTLRHYVLTHRRPPYQLRAVDRLGAYLGRHATFAELRGFEWLRFEQWLRDRYTPKYTRDVVQAIAALVRHHERNSGDSQARAAYFRHRETVAGIPDDPPEGSLWHIFQTRFEPEKVRHLAAITQLHYRVVLRDFDLFLERTAMLADLTDAQVTAYLHWLLSTKNRRGGTRNAVTVNQRRHYLLAFWRWCARKQIVNGWPDVPKLKEPESIPRAWSKEQLDRLMIACRQEAGRIAGVPAADWWTAFHLLLWDTGERTGAVLQLTWDNLELSRGILEAPAHFRKGGRKAMLYVLKPRTCDALRAIQRPVRQLIFEFPHHKATFYNRYDRILERAGLPTGRRHKPQKMRRSFASHLEAAGGNATEGLRHSARSVTERSYLDPSIAVKTPANALLFDIGARKEGGD